MQFGKRETVLDWKLEGCTVLHYVESFLEQFRGALFHIPRQLQPLKRQ
jgi:hypothetical protein